MSVSSGLILNKNIPFLERLGHSWAELDIVETVPRQAELEGCHRNAAATHVSLLWLEWACNITNNYCPRCCSRAR